VGRAKGVSLSGFRLPSVTVDLFGAGIFYCTEGAKNHLGATGVRLGSRGPSIGLPLSVPSHLNASTFFIMCHNLSNGSHQQ